MIAVKFRKVFLMFISNSFVLSQLAVVLMITIHKLLNEKSEKCTAEPVILNVSPINAE